MCMNKTKKCLLKYVILDPKPLLFTFHDVLMTTIVLSKIHLLHTVDLQLTASADCNNLEILVKKIKQSFKQVVYLSNVKIGNHDKELLKICSMYSSADSCICIYKRI